MATIKYWDGSAWQYAVVGKQGPVGPTGPTGPVGATGATGATGPSALTTKGDIATFSTTTTRLAVGANGDTLVADSSQTTGLRYNPPVGSLANPVINGGFDVWQRGTSFTLTTTAAYTADRWQGRTSNTAATVYSRQTTGDTTNLPNIQYCLRVQRPNGATSTAALIVDNLFETVNSIPYAGKTITLSFYARAGANYSATSGNLAAQLRTGTGTDQNLYTTGYTGAVTAINQNAALTTTWQRFAYTATLNSNITEMAVTFEFTPTGTAGANDYYEVTGVQIDVGTWTASTAPTFRRSGGTLAGELAACQRYYWRNVDDSTTTGSVALASGMTQNASGTEQGYYLAYPVTMRVRPTFTLSNLMVTDYASYNNAATLRTTNTGYMSAFIGTTCTAAGAQYRPAFLAFNDGAGQTGFLEASAEL